MQRTGSALTATGGTGMILKTKLLGHVYDFPSVREVMAKANEEKSGDRLAGIAAENAEERVAAKVVLANLTLGDLRNSPAVPYETDEVTRIIQDDVNEKIYAQIRNWTVSELREWILDEKNDGAAIRRISRFLKHRLKCVTDSKPHSRLISEIFHFPFSNSLQA